MNKNLFKQLCMNYGKEADKDLYELWKYNLRCFDESEMQETINFIISQEKYFPTLNKILETAKDIVRNKKTNYDNEKLIEEKAKRLNIKSNWIGKIITNEKLDEESLRDIEEFKVFLEEFRNDKII